MVQIPNIKELRKKYGKHDAQGPILKACDYVAVYPGKLFLYTHLTPNHITVLGILMKIIGALFLITGNYAKMIGGLLLFYLGSIMDGADGVVARFRKHYSLNGIYLDYFCHYFCNSLLLVALAIGTYRQTGDLSYYLAVAIAVFSFLLSKALTINLAWFDDKKKRDKINNIISNKNLSLKNQKNKFIAIIFDFLRIENPFNLMFWGVVFRYSGAVLWIYALFFSLEMARKLLIQFLRIYNSEKN